jgi:hypothetical protein
MALEELKAEIALLLEKTQSPPEDWQELYLQVRQKLNELRGYGMELPQDLIELEEMLEAEMARQENEASDPSDTRST